MGGMSGDVKRLCEAKTIEEQDTIWKGSLRKIFVQGSFVTRLVDNPIFLWNALGVRRTCSSELVHELIVSLACSFLPGPHEPEEGIHRRRHCV